MRSPFFMPVPAKIQWSGLRDDPVAAAVDRLDVAGPDQVALVGAALGEGAVLLLAIRGVLGIAAVGAAAEHDAVGPAVACSASAA